MKNDTNIYLFFLVITTILLIRLINAESQIQKIQTDIYTQQTQLVKNAEQINLNYWDRQVLWERIKEEEINDK